MRYVIVCVVRGIAGEFNNKLRKEVWEKLGTKSSRLPAHFTIKAPFEYKEDLVELDNILKEFVKNEKAEPFKLKGYDHFDDRVIYMKVNMSEEGKLLHDRLIDLMSTLPYMQFKQNDGKGKVFHVTVSSKRITPIFNELWNYVEQYPVDFDCVFDNISIYKWEQNTWYIDKIYELKK